MTILADDLGDIAWTATRQNGVPVLCLQAENPRANQVMSGILIEELHIRSTTPEMFILIEGFGRPNVLLESSIHPTAAEHPGSVERDVAALVDADWNGKPWRLIIQFSTLEGDQRARIWQTEGKSGVRTRLLPGIGRETEPLTHFWPVRIFG